LPQDNLDHGLEPAIRVRGLYKIFGRNPGAILKRVQAGESKDEILKSTGHTLALADVNFEVLPGEIFIVMGLSGSGKSTLVRCLNRLITPTAGEIWIGNSNVAALKPRELRHLRMKKMAMVFQGFGLFPHRTVLDNAAFGLEVAGVKREERYRRALEVLEVVGLKGWADAYPDQLSGGMQQRVGLARALAPDPDILLMDEPFSALDPLIRREMQDELLDLQDRLNKTIVFITHDLDEALKLGNRIAIMKDGRIVQIGKPEQILMEPADDYVASFIGDVDRSKVLHAGDVMMRPDALVRIDHTPRIALRKMEQEGLSSVFVVGPGRKLAGIVTLDDAIAAANREEENLEHLLLDDFPTTGPDTPLQDLIPVAARTRFPIAVIDQDRRLLGIIVRVTILRALVNGAQAQPKPV